MSCFWHMKHSGRAQLEWPMKLLWLVHESSNTLTPDFPVFRMMRINFYCFLLSWLILIMKLTESRIMQDTHFWVCHRGCKTYFKCGWHHCVGWGSGVNKEKGNWALAFISLCFLNVGIMWPATPSSCCHALPSMYTLPGVTSTPSSYELK